MEKATPMKNNTLQEIRNTEGIAYSALTEKEKKQRDKILLKERIEYHQNKIEQHTMWLDRYSSINNL